MSRWTTRLAWAWATASSTSRNRRSRASMRNRGALAVLIDRLAVDVFEHEVRLAGRRDAGVDEMGDARMAKPGEDGAFALEPRLTAALDERDVQQLDRGAALEPAVAAFGEPHVAAAALADGGEQPIRAEDLTRERRHERQTRIDDDALEEARVVDRLVAGEDAIGDRRRGRDRAPRSTPATRPAPRPRSPALRRDTG